LVDINIFRRNLSVILAIIFIFISILKFTSFNYAQENGDPLHFSSNIGFNEYSEIKDTILNASEINILLPEENWTVSDININFTDIELANEIKTIEDTETGTELVWNKNSIHRNFALGTQLEIIEDTELFGVYIKGYKTIQAIETIKFQIQGYNEGNQSPNNTIYRSIDFNISTNLDWYYQDFSLDPIFLSPGFYSLVLNGTDLPLNAEAKYYWQIDDLDPDIPLLYTSKYVTSWDTGTVNTTFLYRLNQKINRSYFPSNINMTAELNGDTYEVINGPLIGTGSLEINALDHIFEGLNLIIPLKINHSVTLKFNYNYSIKLENSFTTEALATSELSHNSWLISPEFTRISQNYHVQFNIPESWYNFTISRKLSGPWENVTSLVIIDYINNTITIPNGTIEEDYEWKIDSYSPNINFNLEMAITEWKRGDELEFSVTTPSTLGNLSFLISKPSGKTELIDTEESISGLIFFEYEIPLNWTEGTYIGKVYWNNETDIGMKTQDFQIIVLPTPFTLEPWMILVIIASIVGFSVATLLSYRGIKSLRDKQIEKKQKLYNSCMDVINLDYLMVTDKRSGLNVYTQNFTQKEIDAALISGFLQAIHSFGIELIKVEDQSQIIKLEYKDSIVLMSEFVNVRLILIMKERPSRFFLYSIEELTYDIYKIYGSMIESFNGDVKKYQSIEDLLKQHLNAAFIYPLKIAQIEKLEKLRITQNERLYINKAVSWMKTNKKDYFLIKSILPGKECSPKDVEIIIKLMEKKIFQVI
jgi:hypothetical protein